MWELTLQMEFGVCTKEMDASKSYATGWLAVVSNDTSEMDKCSHQTRVSKHETNTHTFEMCRAQNSNKIIRCELHGDETMIFIARKI